MPEPLRLELDSVLRCPSCAGVPYKVFRRQLRPGEPIWESVLWPASPDVPPPSRAERVACPDCDVELRRGAP
jgi:hypothetical protein